MLKRLGTNIRFYILTSTVCIIIGVFAWTYSTTPAGSVRTIKLVEHFAMLAILYLYLALLVTPLYEAFPRLPFRSPVHKARRAIGFSAFLFGLFHAYNAFFGLLGGFKGLGLLSPTYLKAITLSFTALCILTAMASTSFDVVVKRLGYRKWKRLHRLVYIAAIFIVIHALMLGSDFANSSSLFYQLVFFAVAFLFCLEMLRVDRLVQARIPALRRWNLITFLAIILVVGMYANNTAKSGQGILLKVHNHRVSFTFTQRSSVF